MTGRNRPDGGTCEADGKEAGHDLTLTQVLELRQEDEPDLRSQSPLGSGQPTPQALNPCSTEAQPTNGTVRVINTSPVAALEFGESVLEDRMCADSCADGLCATNLDMEGAKGVPDRVVLASMACHGGNEGVQPGSIAEEVDADALKTDAGAEEVHGLCEVGDSSEEEDGEAQQQQQQQQQPRQQEPEQRRQQDHLPDNGIDTELCGPHEETKEHSPSPVRNSSAKRKRPPCSSEGKRSREVACLRDCNRAGASTRTHTPGKTHKPPTTIPRQRGRRRKQTVPEGFELLGPYVPSGTDYGLEMIIDMRVMPDQKREFLCRWHGHSETWATWEMEEFLPTDMVQPYLTAWDERVKTWRAIFEEDDEERREQRKNKKGVRRRGRTTVEEVVSDAESEARTEPLEQQDDEQRMQLLSDDGGAWEPEVEGEEEMKAGLDGVEQHDGPIQCGGIEDLARLPVHDVAEMGAAGMAEQDGSGEGIYELFGKESSCSTT